MRFRKHGSSVVSIAARLAGYQDAPRFCHTFGHSPILWQISSFEQLLSARPDSWHAVLPATARPFPSVDFHRLLWYYGPDWLLMGSAMPCNTGYILRAFPQISPHKGTIAFIPCQPPHLRGEVQVVWDFFDLFAVSSALPRLVCDFCSSAQNFCLRLPPDSISRWTPLPFG